ncbi:MAG: hypothetical protein NTZ33_06075 [Bacteroidetes bacterium]|nr:hypothetical protein [Bacteroidota bacterium]
MKKFILFFFIISITCSVLSQTNQDTVKSAIIPYNILFFKHKPFSISTEKFYSIKDYQKIFDKNLNVYLKFDNQYLYMLTNYTNIYINLPPDRFFKPYKYPEDRIRGLYYSIDESFYYMNSYNVDNFPEALISGSLNYAIYKLFYEK